jgi:RNA polymerase sigma factor (sigma-70 family)
MERVFREHGAFVVRTARRLGVSAGDLDDVAQEVFMVIHRKLPDYDPATPLRAWLFGIVRNAACDYRKKAYRKREVPTDVHYRGTPLVEPKPLVSKDDAAPPDTQSSPERQSAPESASPEEPAPVPRRNAASSRAARQTLSVEASVKAEAELLHRARSALKKNPEEALSLTEEHETSYPAGVLAEERDFIAINALKRMGREEEACERAARFIAAHPKAAQASALAEMCERADTSAKRAPISGKP